ncbi:methyltransferase FkbM domain protein [Mycobacterium kansasii 662]|uniref:Methyltransferase FkbM domain protein n=1 Tax=Mycobacterium kansasii 662 TaxID=1299326 RepID=X7XPF4_MYCKA|nr:methyltransferase FkbM domain protein [Mycobacterium kansasii 662]
MTAENIDQLMLDRGFEGDIGLLHIDIDGNDYWVWRGLTAVRPGIAIIEYNSVFGVEARDHGPVRPQVQQSGTLRQSVFRHIPAGAVRPGPI